MLLLIKELFQLLGQLSDNVPVFFFHRHQAYENYINQYYAEIHCVENYMHPTHLAVGGEKCVTCILQ